MTDFEDDMDTPVNEQELDAVHQAVLDTVDSLLDEDSGKKVKSSKANKAFLAKTLREQTRKDPIIVKELFSVLLDTAKEVFTSTVNSFEKEDGSLMKESANIINLVIDYSNAPLKGVKKVKNPNKNGYKEYQQALKQSDLIRSHVGETILDLLEETSVSKFHSVEMLKSLNHLIKKYPAEAGKNTSRILEITKSMAINAAKECDTNDRDIFSECIGAICNVGDSGLKSDETRTISRAAISILSEVMTKMNKNIANPSRSDMFNDAANSMISFIEADPTFYKREMRADLFSTLGKMQFNASSVRLASKAQEEVEDIKDRMDTAFTRALAKNLKTARR